jgi:hypothetical protein
MTCWFGGGEAGGDDEVSRPQNRYCDAFAFKANWLRTLEDHVGEIIRLPVRLADYPDTAAALEPAECVLLIAIRWWVEAYRHDEDPMPRLQQGLETAGVQEAAFSIDAVMAVVARSVLQPVAIHCPRCPHLSADEKSLLHAASLAQSGAVSLAEKALRGALLSAQGAEFALGPLQGLGELFAGARMLLRRRKPPTEDQPTTEAALPWTPDAPRTLH